jgi:hypothetical protein
MDRCLRSLEDRLQHTSFSLQQVLRRVVCTVSGRLLGGVLAHVSPESSLQALYSQSSYPLLALIELQTYLMSNNQTASAAAPKQDVCLLLRMLPLFVSGISFSKYATTFLATWTPLLFMLVSTRVVSLRKLRGFLTRLWALALLNPFVSAPFWPSGATPAGPPPQLREGYSQACSAVTAFPTVAEVALFEDPVLDLSAASARPSHSQPGDIAIASTSQSVYTPSASSSSCIRGRSGASGSSYGSNSCSSGMGMSSGGLGAGSRKYTSAMNASSFASFHRMWQSRMQGFCEYVLCNDALWQGRESHTANHNQASSSAASRGQWRASATSSRIDLVMEIVLLLSKQADSDFRRVTKEGKHLLLKLKRHVMHIGVILCGRMLRYLLGDGIGDIISEEVDMSQQSNSQDSSLIDQCAFYLFLCHRVVTDVTDDDTAPAARGVAAVPSGDVAKWKEVLKIFSSAVSPPDLTSLDLKHYHTSVAVFLTLPTGSTYLHGQQPALLVEEARRHQSLLQPHATAPLGLRRSRSDTLAKMASTLHKALCASV